MSFIIKRTDRDHFVWLIGASRLRAGGTNVDLDWGRDSAMAHPLSYQEANQIKDALSGANPRIPVEIIEKEKAA